MGAAEPTTVSTEHDAGAEDNSGRMPAVAAVLPVMPVKIDLVVALADVEADWLRLESDPLNSLHQSLDWCTMWAQSHNKPLVVIRGRIDGRTVFLLPLEIVKTRFVRIARFPGGSFNNINTGLFDADFAASTDAMVADHIAHQIRRILSGKADVIALQNVPLVWRGRAHPLASLASVENQNHSFQLPLLQSFEATIAQLNAKRRRKKFRVQSRRAEEIGGYSHLIARTSDEKHALLDTFFQQKAERFSAQKIPDVFQEARTQAFFHSLLDVSEKSLDTPLELHAIRLAGQHDGVIAAVSGLSRKGDHVICQFGSINDNVAREASPGELLFWLMIERACQEKAALFDFGVGDQSYKRSWCPMETVQHDILIPVSFSGKLAALGLIATANAKAAIKANPRLYAWLQELRAKTRRKTEQTADISEN